MKNKLLYLAAILTLTIYSCEKTESLDLNDSAFSEKQIIEAQAILKVDSREEIIKTLRISQTEPFVDLMKMLAESRELDFSDGKYKRSTLKENTTINQDKFINALSSAKNEQDLINAYSIIFKNPKEIYSFVSKTGKLANQSIIENKRYLNGFTENKKSEIFQNAIELYLVKNSKISKLRTSSCFGCGASLNIALDALDRAFGVGLIACTASIEIPPLYAACLGGAVYAYFNERDKEFDQAEVCFNDSGCF